MPKTFGPLLVLVAIAAVAFNLNFTLRSQLLIDPYWRYQGLDWSQLILTTGHFFPNAFSAPVLSVSSNGFFANVLPPEFVSIFSLVTSINLDLAYRLPIFLFPMIILSGLIGYKLTQNAIGGVTAAILGIILPYRFLQFDYSAHRISMSFLYFDVILLLLILTFSTRDKRFAGLLVLSLLFFILLYWTTAVTAIVFFLLVFSFISFTSRRKELPFAGLLYTVATIIFYSVAFSFINIPIQIFVQSYSIADLFSPTTLQSFVPGYLVLNLHLPLWHPVILLTSNLFAFGSLLLAGIIALGSTLSKRRMGIFEIITFSFGLYVASTIPVQSILHVVSGGVDPSFLVFMMSPIFSAYVLIALFRPETYLPWLPNFYARIKLPKQFTRVLAIFVTIICVISAFATLTYSMGPELNLVMVQSDQVALSTWLAGESNGLPVMSDFNFLATYLAVNGDLNTFLPYVTTFDRFQSQELLHFGDITKAYYLEPASYANHTVIYVSTETMQSGGIFSIDGIWTKPNPVLSQLLQNTTDVIYDDGYNQVGYPTQY